MGDIIMSLFFFKEIENTHTMNSISESRDHGVKNGGDC